MKIVKFLGIEISDEYISVRVPFVTKYKGFKCKVYSQLSWFHWVDVKGAIKRKFKISLTSIAVFEDGSVVTYESWAKYFIIFLFPVSYMVVTYAYSIFKKYIR